MQVIYVGEDGDNEVTQAVTDVLNDNADHISGLVDEFESIELSIEFRGVSTARRASISPPRPDRNGSHVRNGVLYQRRRG